MKSESMYDWWLRQPLGVRMAVYILIGFVIGTVFGPMLP